VADHTKFIKNKNLMGYLLMLQSAPYYCWLKLLNRKTTWEGPFG